MPLDPRTWARARLALAVARRGCLYDRNVTAIDFGFPERDGALERDRLAIRFHVARKLRGIALESAVAARVTAPMPTAVGEFATDVVEARYRTHFDPWWHRSWWTPWSANASDPRRRRRDPLSGGVSVSRDLRGGPGTLGAIVLDRDSQAPMILSNWHVIVTDWTTRPGAGLLQPARGDGGLFADRVARYERDAMSANLDAAVARVDGDRSLSAEQLELGRARGVMAPALGQVLAKSGRTTRVTRGEITGIGGTVKLRYAGLERAIREVVSIEPLATGAQVSAGGDSGSLWIDANTRAAVGLHFAGGNAPERALAMSIGPVLDALAIDLA